MRDIDRMKELRQKYHALIDAHGKDVTDYQAFRESLLELNRRHRAEAIRMYAEMISRVEKKVAGR